MNVLQFIASIVGSVAWPVVACAMVLILRHPLVDMLQRGRLKRLKAGPSGLEVEYFDEKLQEARAELGEAPTGRADLKIDTKPVEVESRADDFLKEMEQLAEVAPSAVITESFSRLERTLRKALDSDSPVNAGVRSRRFSTAGLGEQAVEKKIITSSEFAAWQDLRVLRNLVAHAGDKDLDASRAMEYAKVARQLIIAITLASEKTNLNGALG